MENFDRIMDNFINGDYFIVFLILVLIILVVLIAFLIKSRFEYNELLNEEKDKKDFFNDDKDIIDEFDLFDENDSLKDDILNEEALKEEISKEINEDKPIIKEVDVPNIKTYDDVINEYESSEEENAVISAEELEKRTRERMENLGLTDNQMAIQKYEEDQEKKAIISYEQLLKNASNITLSYKNETKGKGSPKVNKVEVEKKEVVGTEIYLEEEEFLKILKEFRISL